MAEPNPVMNDLWTNKYITVNAGNSIGNTGRGKRFYFSISIQSIFYTLMERTMSLSKSINQIPVCPL